MGNYVKVTFKYMPEEPDPDDKTGVSAAEHERVSDQLMMRFGAEDIKFEKISDD